MFRAIATRAPTCARAIGRRNASTNVAVQNLESRWTTLSTAEQNSIAKQLEEAQKGDWKVLSLDEKKAACKFYSNGHFIDSMDQNLDGMVHKVTFWHALSFIDYVAFGPHGPRTPVNGPGHNGKVVAGVAGVLTASAALFYVIRANGGKCSSFSFKAWV